MPLKKQLGLLPVTLSGIGVILGAGIYALIGEAAGIAGYGMWLSFALAALVAGFTGLSYAELSAMIPKAGAEFYYSKKAFGKSVGFFTAWLLMLAGFVSAATVALGFGGYLQALSNFPQILGAIGVLVFSTIVIWNGVKQSTGIAGIMTLVEALGLAIIIAVGLQSIFSFSFLQKAFDFSAFSGIAIVQGAALVFFAFIGFEDIARLSEETKNPGKNIPKALMIAIIVSTILYVLVSLSALSVLGPELLSASKAPLGSVAGMALGSSAFAVLAVIALISTASTVLLILLATSRILYGVAEDNELPHIIARIDKKTNTPAIALFVALIFSAGFIFLGNISTVANATVFLLFIAFIIINLSVIKLRYSMPKAERPFKIPFNIGKIPLPSVLGAIACLFLITGIKTEIIIIVILLSVLGVVFELFYKHKHEKRKQAG